MLIRLVFALVTCCSVAYAATSPQREKCEAQLQVRVDALRDRLADRNVSVGLNELRAETRAISADLRRCRWLQ
jgi:hypothetical protein